MCRHVWTSIIIISHVDKLFVYWSFKESDLFHELQWSLRNIFFAKFRNIVTRPTFSYSLSLAYSLGQRITSQSVFFFFFYSHQNSPKIFKYSIQNSCDITDVVKNTKFAQNAILRSFLTSPICIGYANFSLNLAMEFWKCIMNVKLNVEEFVFSLKTCL